MNKYVSIAVALTSSAAMVTGTQSPASSASDKPTPAQRIAAAGVDPDKLPAGWTLVGNEIVWGNNDVMLSLEPMAYSDCSDTYLCFWEDKDFTGRRLQFHDVGLRGDMRDYSFDDMMSSWRNRKVRDARWYYDREGTGTSRCIENGASTSDVGAGFWNNDNDEMSSFRIYSSGSVC